ncbi:MAG TPA: DUF1592 domain-containing protein [Polyangia bacterium]|nr:DUF1592 domain-containing protein [Polyangia bacterium]
MKASFDSVSENQMPARHTGHLFATALVCSVLACSGQVGEPGQPINPGAGGNGNGSGGGNGGGNQPGVDPGTKTLHRLNSAEYNATVADVLGTKMQPANSSWLGAEVEGFDNIAVVLDLDDAQYKRYFDTAEMIAEDVFANANLKAKVVTCATEDATCVQSIISAAGRRLFRRPMTSDEVGTYNKVYTAARGLGENHEGGIKQVMRALLSSSEFLYRIEFDPNPASPTKHPVAPFELASRLSYFLWSSAPDDALLDAAADGSLTQDDKLRATVVRMLADPVKSRRFVENFAGQWLGARKLPEHPADATLFPQWSSDLASSLTQEMYLYFNEFLQGNRPWVDFMTADINYVDANVAKLYGVPAGSAPGFQQMEIKTDKRVGFTGLGGFLALSSLGDRTSPTLRGKWILRNLLCSSPPDPPPGVAGLAASGLDPTKNVRVALEEHRKNPSCAACHSLFDPMGLSLEQFDAIGKFRTTYTDGSTIDPSAELDGVKFSGLEGLADVVSKNTRFSECISEVLFKYGLGRTIDDTDRPYLNQIQTEWKKGAPTLHNLVQSLVLAETFRYRHGSAGN